MTDKLSIKNKSKQQSEDLIDYEWVKKVMQRQTLLPIGMLNENDMQNDKVIMNKESSLESVQSIECALMLK